VSDKNEQAEAARRAWVLDHETKGTGAQMLPLEKVHTPAGTTRAAVVVREPPPLPEKPVEPAGPRRFKVVDVMTRRVLAEDVGLRTAVDVLEEARSVVDVNVYVWREPAQEWLQLSQRDRRKLWELRGREHAADA
jgi:hypothetical protein